MDSKREVKLQNGTTVSVPENIGDDFAVYVNKVDDITSIVGYRSGSVWYNELGQEINDPTVLDKGSGISPWLVNTEQRKIDTKS